MQISDITSDLRNTSSSRIEKKLDSLLRSPRYKTVNDENRDLILTLIEKYKRRAKRGTEISTRMIKKDRSYLYSNRLNLGLSKVDLEHMYNLLDSFKE